MWRSDTDVVTARRASSDTCRATRLCRARGRGQLLRYHQLLRSATSVTTHLIQHSPTYHRVSAWLVCCPPSQKMADDTLGRSPPYAAGRSAQLWQCNSFEHAAACELFRSPATAHIATDAHSSFFFSSSSPLPSPSPSAYFRLPLTPLPTPTLHLPDESAQSSSSLHCPVFLAGEPSIRLPDVTSTLASPPPPPALPFGSSSSTAQKPAKLTRRQKQRRADSERRKRVGAALEELTQLVTAAEAYTGSSAEQDAEEGEQDAAKRHRAGLLESTSQCMKQLLGMVHALKRTCETQQQTIDSLRGEGKERNTDTAPQRLSHSVSSYAATPYNSASAKRIRLLASAVSRSLDASLGHHALDSSTFVPATLSVALVDCSTGVALDVTHAGADMLGWGRSQIIGSPITLTYDMVMSDQWPHAQYGRSKRLKRELYTGVIDVCHMVWRMQMAGGKLYELHFTLWIDGWQSATGADGKVVRRPLRVVGVVSSSHKILVDDTLDPVLADE